tara:strand:- start:652 stop:1545 length:894 start_codon:yes stop_codon:yes gene_type:complete
MISNKLYCLNKHLVNLIDLLDKDKFPQILMLSGKKGQGKFTLIYHLMSYILDKTNYDLKNTRVNETNILYNNINKDFNSNIIYFNCANRIIKIDDIRNLRVDLQKSSINNIKRFIIFDDVEYLNDNCINALLKTVEEPSDINYFVMINNQSQNLLDTLKSRSIELKFFLNKEEKKEIIKNLILDFKIEEKINLNNSTLTPGNYLKFNKIILEDKIDINDELIINIKKLLKLHKLKKNIDYQNFVIYLINQYYFDKSKNDNKFDYYNDKRINIIKKIDESYKLNLNQSNLIIEIENHI